MKVSIVFDMVIMDYKLRRQTLWVIVLLFVLPSRRRLALIIRKFVAEIAPVAMLFMLKR